LKRSRSGRQKKGRKSSERKKGIRNSLEEGGKDLVQKSRNTIASTREPGTAKKNEGPGPKIYVSNHEEGGGDSGE